MNADELKALQSPLKDAYRDNPQSAVVTLRAEGNVGEGISCKVSTGQAIVEAGLHPATGGTGIQLCSGDMLLEALVACAGVTLRAVSTATGIEINEGKIVAEGDIDFRGTLGVSKEAAVGFKAIRLFFHLHPQLSSEQLATLSKLTERYCVVYQTLVKAVEVTTEYNN
jgi:uncharacterized OsmC-like protein